MNQDVHPVDREVQKNREGRGPTRSATGAHTDRGRQHLSNVLTQGRIESTSEVNLNV